MGNSSKLQKKRFGIILALTIIAPSLISLAVNLAADPFEIFSKSNKTPHVFLGGRGQDRYQHIGVIRQYQPKSIIIGHSLAANFLPTSVEKHLNWENTYSLTLDGGPLYEQSRVAEYALRHSKIENVLWLFNPQSLGSAPNLTNYKMPFPEYLYDANRINDLALFATLPKELAKYVELKGQKRSKIIKEIEISGTTIDTRDRSTSWFYSSLAKFNRPDKIADKILGKFPRIFDKVSTLSEKQDLKSMQAASLALADSANFDANVNGNLLSLVLAYPEVNFKFIVLSPLPRLLWKRIKVTEESEYLRILASVSAFVKEASKYSNIEVYGFGSEKFTTDLRLYKDAMHYHVAVHEFMLNAIAVKKNKLTTENIDEYLVDFDNFVSIYRFSEERSPKNGKPKKRKKLSISRATNIITSYGDRR